MIFVNYYLGCGANQWTGFYMITASIMKGLKASSFRSNHYMCSIKKVVLKKFAIFVGKHMCWSLFLLKLSSGLQLY